MDIVDPVTQMTEVENVTNTGISAYPFPVMCGHDAWLLVLNEI